MKPGEVRIIEREWDRALLDWVYLVGCAEHDCDFCKDRPDVMHTVETWHHEQAWRTRRFVEYTVRLCAGNSDEEEELAWLCDKCIAYEAKVRTVTDEQMIAGYSKGTAQ